MYICVVVSSSCVFVLCLVYQMLPVSLDCPFWIAPSVFSNVYFDRVVFVFYFLNQYTLIVLTVWYFLPLPLMFYTNKHTSHLVFQGITIHVTINADNFKFKSSCLKTCIHKVLHI